MKFIVDRRTWYRGHGETGSRLLCADGRRCCIGFVAQQSGVPDEQLLGTASIHQRVSLDDDAAPRIESKYQAAFPKWMTDVYWAPQASPASPALGDAYHINDNPGLSDEDREQRLQSIFRRNGDEIEFIN